jgi:hypothetical protein
MSRVLESFVSVLSPQPGCHEGRSRETNTIAIRRTIAARRILPCWQRSTEPGRASLPGRDVICAGMYRACSTWQYEVVGYLVEHHLKGRRLGYVSGESYAGQDGPSGGSTRGDGYPWRVLKSHEDARSFTRGLGCGRALAVYAYRDLRDVVFSLMHKRGTSFRGLLRQGMIHQILANDRFWRSQPRVLVQRYEDLIADPVTGVVQLARHLGLGVARREAEAIADEYSLDSNRNRIASLKRQLLDAGIDLEDPANHQICDSTTLLHWNHLRPVPCGSWKTDATASQRAAIRRLCDRWLLENGYEATGEAGDSGGEYGRDVSIGRLAFLLKRAARGNPGIVRQLKQMLGISDLNPEAVIAWPPGPPH